MKGGSRPTGTQRSLREESTLTTLFRNHKTLKLLKHHVWKILTVLMMASFLHLAYYYTFL